jgi:tRNA (guanosine-2'-O-)-methyltransferase
MRKKWGRYRGYVDELEEDMRQAGEHLSEVEALAAETWERDTWRHRLRATAAADIVRRALDIPFLGDLVRMAWRVGPDVSPHAPDFLGTPWHADTRVHRYDQPSHASLTREATRVEHDPEREAPARLRAAERALAHRTRSIAIGLDDLVSPRNASAILRTADALGLQEVHVVQPTGQPAIERTLTMRAERWVDLTWYRDPEAFIETMRRDGRRILVADFGEDAWPIEEVPLGDKVAIVVGSEQRGVSDAVREAADAHFYLPTVGFTSYLNVSVATALACSTIDRRMREAGLRSPLEQDDLRALRRIWYERLARGDESRAARHRSFLEDPPEPAPEVRTKHQRAPIGDV